MTAPITFTSSELCQMRDIAAHAEILRTRAEILRRRAYALVPEAAHTPAIIDHLSSLVDVEQVDVCRVAADVQLELANIELDQIAVIEAAGLQ